MSLMPEKGEAKYAEGKAILNYLTKQVEEMRAAKEAATASDEVELVDLGTASQGAHLMAKKSQKKPRDEDEGAAISDYLTKQLDEFNSRDVVATGELWAELSKDFDDDTLRFFGVDPAYRNVSVRISQATKAPEHSSEVGPVAKREHPNTEKLLARLRREGLLTETPSNSFTSFAVVGYPSGSKTEAKTKTKTKTKTKRKR